MIAVLRKIRTIYLTGKKPVWLVLAERLYTLPDHCKEIKAVVYKEQILIAISKMQALPAKDANKTDCSISNEKNIKYVQWNQFYQSFWWGISVTSTYPCECSLLR